MDGPLPLTWIDMMAWAHITGNVVRAEEWEIIRKVDRVYIGTLAEERDAAAARAAVKKEQGR